MRRFATLAIATVAFLSCVAPTSAQQAPADWLVGRWDGTSGNVKVILSVRQVSGDGAATGRWGIAGQFRGPAKDFRAEDSRVSLVTGGGFLVELAREGDDRLTGQVTRKDGSKTPVSLTRVTSMTEFDGRWEGSAAPTDRNNCWPGSYDVVVKDGLIDGAVEFVPFQGQPRPGIVIGDIRSDKTASLAWVWDPELQIAGTARFDGVFDKNEFKGTDSTNSRCKYEVWLKRK